MFSLELLEARVLLSVDPGNLASVMTSSSDSIHELNQPAITEMQTESLPNDTTISNDTNDSPDLFQGVELEDLNTLDSSTQSTDTPPKKSVTVPVVQAKSREVDTEQIQVVTDQISQIFKTDNSASASLFNEQITTQVEGQNWASQLIMTLNAANGPPAVSNPGQSVNISMTADSSRFDTVFLLVNQNPLFVLDASSPLNIELVGAFVNSPFKIYLDQLLQIAGLAPSVDGFTLTSDPIQGTLNRADNSTSVSAGDMLPSYSNWVWAPPANSAGNIIAFSLHPTTTETPDLSTKVVVNIKVGMLNLPSNGIQLDGSVGNKFLDEAAEVMDASNVIFENGTLTVSFVGGGGANDNLLIHDDGIASIQVDSESKDVIYNGIAFGVVSGGEGGTPLIVTFNSSADALMVEALTRNIQFNTPYVLNNSPKGIKVVLDVVATNTSHVISEQYKTVTFGKVLYQGEFDRDIGERETFEIAQGNDGSCILVGKIPASITFPAETPIELSGVDGGVFIARRLNNGNFEWAEALHGDVTIRGITVGGSGDVYISGRYRGVIDFDPSEAGVSESPMVTNYDYFILKLDSAGAFVWVKYAGGASFLPGNSSNGKDYIEVDSDGFLYVAGMYNGPGFFGDHEILYTGSGDAGNWDDDGIFLTKIEDSVSGGFVWANKFDGEGSTNFLLLNLINMSLTRHGLRPTRNTF